MMCISCHQFLPILIWLISLYSPRKCYIPCLLTAQSVADCDVVNTRIKHFLYFLFVLVDQGSNEKHNEWQRSTHPACTRQDAALLGPSSCHSTTATNVPACTDITLFKPESSNLKSIRSYDGFECDFRLGMQSSGPCLRIPGPENSTERVVFFLLLICDIAMPSCSQARRCVACRHKVVPALDHAVAHYRSRDAGIIASAEARCDDAKSCLSRRE